MKIIISIACTLLVIFLFGVIFFSCTPTGKAMWNRYDYAMKKTDEKTYKNQKEVEDTCRSMIASYNSDKLIYEQYKDSENQEEKSWANNAKIRANTTATTYNEYILKNSYVWKGNIPSDISYQLTILN